MKIWNQHLALYIFVVIIITLIFRILLSYGISSHSMLLSIGVSIGYFFILFFTARYIARNYYHEYLGQDYGLIWHVATYIFAILLGWLWVKYGARAVSESIVDIYRLVIGWGFGLAAHFLVYLFAKPKTIKGISESDLFE